MAIEQIHTFLVHPRKGAEVALRIGGTVVPLSGKLFTLLEGIYSKSQAECNIDISFNHSADGKQVNPCRNAVVAYIKEPTIVHGRLIAERLEKVTTLRSGLGLLFLMAGKEGGDHKIVISRFPADSAILVEEDQRSLSVEFLERVFMKRATAYKAVEYKHSSLAAGFWQGRAVDKQINIGQAHLSNYWIAEFLESDFRTTSAAGTRRLAMVLRDAVRSSGNVVVKSEIAAAVTLAPSLHGQRMSIRNFGDQFKLSEAAMSLIATGIKQPSLIEEQFQFDAKEFSKQLAYRTVELDSGGMLTAEATEFDKVFRREVLDDKEQLVRYSTEGRVTAEKLVKTP